MLIVENLLFNNFRIFFLFSDFPLRLFFFIVKFHASTIEFFLLHKPMYTVYVIDLMLGYFFFIHKKCRFFYLYFVGILNHLCVKIGGFSLSYNNMNADFRIIYIPNFCLRRENR